MLVLLIKVEVLTNKSLLKPVQMQETFQFIPGKSLENKVIKMYIADSNNKYLPLIKGMLFVMSVLEISIFYLI